MSSVERKVVAISIVQIGKLRFGYAGLHDTVTQETHVWFGKVLFQIQYLEEISGVFGECFQTTVFSF